MNCREKVTIFPMVMAKITLQGRVSHDSNAPHYGTVRRDVTGAVTLASRA